MTNEEQKRLCELSNQLFSAVDDYFDTPDFCESGNELATQAQAIYYALLDLRKGKKSTKELEKIA